jgi:hypothetical protein
VKVGASDSSPVLIGDKVYPDFPKILYCDPSADLTVAVLTRLKESYRALPH